MSGDKYHVSNKVTKAESRIESNAYDIEAWGILIREAQKEESIEKARETYERLVTQFPTSGRYWKIYIEHEMKARSYEKVEKLFQRCLMKVQNIDLWKCYLFYVKETKGSLSTYREKMAQAYDFALDKMGMDVMSYQIWAEYIQFLKGVEAVGSYAENQRITAVRRVYQRGCANPMMSIEQLWRDYNTYENGINPLIAKKMIDDRSRDYMNARRVAKEYEAVTRGLNRNMPSVPPNGTMDENKQVELWKKYIVWERNNPLRTEDQILITKRVMFAYEQCLLCLGHHPDIWYEAAQYLEMASKTFSEKGDVNNSKVYSDEAASIYERAINTLLKNNMLLYFAYADFEESRMKYQKVHSIYQKILGMEEVDPTLAYILYMRFARRTEGIKSGRAVFKKAREDSRTQYHVFIAAALMEYYCSKDKQIAFKIFELGLKKYGDVPEYILAYVDYLSHLNEENNTRVLFERVLSSGSLPSEKSREIWQRFQDFESTCGDLASILKVEKRRQITFKEEYAERETVLLIDRYRYLDLFPCSPSDLKAIGYQDNRVKYLGTLQGATPVQSYKKTELSSESFENETKPQYPLPDTSQMLPFKPKKFAPFGAHPVPGGEFPMPPAASHLINILPPPACFQGPFVKINLLLKQLEESSLSDVMTNVGENGLINESTEMLNKRKKKTDGSSQANDDSEEEDSSTAPVHDIYRTRQQKKVKGSSGNW